MAGSESSRNWELPVVAFERVLQAVGNGSGTSQLPTCFLSLSCLSFQSLEMLSEAGCLEGSLLVVLQTGTLNLALVLVCWGAYGKTVTGRSRMDVQETHDTIAQALHGR